LDVIVVLLALAFLIVVAYRGYSVILFAPLAALLAVALTAPALVLPFFSGLFLERMAGFIKLYFPMFLLGAIFGKLVELSGFAQAIIRAVVRVAGPEKAILAIVLACAILTYGGVSLFVVVFAVYPFAAGMFRAAGIPKRLIPATIALGAFTFTMDALPGSPQVQNLIPTAFFQTTAWAAPLMGTVGGLFILIAGVAYLEWRRRQAARAGEGYGDGHRNEPLDVPPEALPPVLLAVLPLVAVGVLNRLCGQWLRASYGKSFDFTSAGVAGVAPLEIERVAATWAVEIALVAAILMVLPFAWRRARSGLASGSQVAVAGAMLAAMNTASEYGFGAVIAALPGFQAVNTAVSQAIRDPLLNVAATVNALSAITGSSSGGLSLALAASGGAFLEMARTAGIPADVLHRVAAMASGGLDTLPHNGAIITLLLVTGLTHRQAYKDIFAMTGIKVAAVLVAIAFYRVFQTG
jgi:H+/gluconate symporter-like permease